MAAWPWLILYLALVARIHQPMAQQPAISLALWRSRRYQWQIQLIAGSNVMPTINVWQ